MVIICYDALLSFFLKILLLVNTFKNILYLFVKSTLKN
jgi:hypothetical protein